MTSPDDQIADEMLDEAIVQVRQGDPVDKRVSQAIEAVNRRIARQLVATGPAGQAEPNARTGRAGHSVLKKHTGKLAMAVAASIVLAIFSTLSFDGSAPVESATYAQALRALRSASTLYAKYYHSAGDDQQHDWKLFSETWYSDKGVTRTFRHPNRRWPDVCHQIATIDWDWEVYPSQKLVVRRAAASRPEFILEELSSNMFLEYIDRANRVESGDETIRGVPCRLYVALPRSATTQPHLSMEEKEKKFGRVYLWVDERGCVHRSEGHGWRKGELVPVTRAEVEYDVTLDPGLFSTSFPSAYREIDLDETLERMFDLKHADMVREINGMVIAFHDTRRIDDRTATTTVTIRPTEENRRRLLPRNRRQGNWDGYAPGEFSFWSGGLPYEKTILGEVTDQRLRVVWVILRSASDDVLDPPAIEFDYVVYVRAQPLLEYEGLKQSSGVQRGLLKIPAGSAVKVRDCADTVYDQLEELVQYCPRWIHTRFGDPLSKGAHASRAEDQFKLRISRQAFRNAVVERIGAPETLPAAVAQTQTAPYAVD